MRRDLTDLLDRPGWQALANCRGLPHLFFPTRGESPAEAKAVCAGCVVRDQCLEAALANNEHWGIWGGTSDRERRRIKARMVAERKGAA